MRTSLSTTIAVFVLATAAAALAQPSWERTGTVQVTVGGEEIAMSTFAAQVREDLADDVEDEEASEFAARVAGTEQNTATWMATEAVTVGDSVVAPAALHVIVDARGGDGPDEGLGALDLEFALDPASLTRLDAFDTTVRYHPESYDVSDYYEMTEGSLTVRSAELVDPSTIRVRGSVEGTLTASGDVVAEYGLDETLPIRATFDIERVVGSTQVQELLGGD